jgi:hypothetical protein
MFQAAMGFLCAALICGAGARAQCAPGSLVVIVNKASTVESLSMAQLRKVMLGDVRTWPDRKPVMVVSREPSSPAAQCVLSKVVRLSDAEYHRYIMSAEFRGDEAMVVQTINSDLTIGRFIAGTTSAVAVVQASSLPAIASSVKVLRIEGKLPGEAGYPL